MQAGVEPKETTPDDNYGTLMRLASLTEFLNRTAASWVSPKLHPSREGEVSTVGVF